jgi:hypothetical protein
MQGLNCNIYYINVWLPNLDLKLGIGPKAGNFLSGKREGEWGGGETETEGREREIDGKN